MGDAVDGSADGVSVMSPLGRRGSEGEARTEAREEQNRKRRDGEARVSLSRFCVPEHQSAAVGRD
jgi:hypothetical protein